MNVVTFVYDGNGERADVVISVELGITRSNAAKLIEEGNAKKGDITLKKNTKLENGATITVLFLMQYRLMLLLRISPSK